MFSQAPKILALAAAIFIAGCLAGFLAVDPGYASPLWPPAGIALAALLIWDKRLWPGILIGSLTLNLWNGYQALGSLNGIAFLAAAGIAAGSTLQALAAQWLSHRFIEPGLPRLDTPRSIVHFILLTGPLASLIASTAGVLTLTATGVIETDALFFSWWNWWIGDSLGVIIITPILLSLFSGQDSLWSARRVTVSMPLTAVLVGLVAMFLFVARAEDERLQLDFENHAADIDKALSQHAENIISGTLATRDLFIASDDVSRQDFALFSVSMIERHPEIQALEWLPRITRDELRRFEAAVRAEGYPSFQVTQRAADGHMEPVADRPEYFPVLYVEPMRSNEMAFGLDSISNPQSRASKLRAKTTGKPAVSGRLQLAQRADDEPAVLVSVPVFASHSGMLRGFISAIVLPRYMASIALKDAETEALGIHLRDLHAPQAEGELFHKTVERPLAADQHPQPWRRTLSFGDRVWELEVTPGQAFVQSHGSALPWISLLGGLIFTGLLSVYLLSITGRTANIENLIEDRTRELQESEASLRNAQNIAQLGSWVLDNSNNRLTWSEQTYRIFNIKPGTDISLETFLDRVHPDDRRMVETSWQNALRGAPYHIEHRILVNGKVRWVRERAELSFDLTGNFVSAVGTVQDITDRKRSEQNLTESELKLRTIVESQPECVKLLNRKGELLQMNRAGLDMIEADSLEQVVGAQMAELVLPEYREAFQNLSREVFIGRSGTLQFEIQGLKGSHRWLETHAVPLRDANGEITALLGLTRDITQRRETQEKLVLASRVFAEAHEGIVITDAKGVIIDVNPTFSEITGYSRDEAIGQTSNILKSGKHSGDFYAAMWQSLIDLGHWQGEVWNRKKNGELYAELLTISALRDEHGHILHFVGLFSDITQSKQQQQTLELMAHYDVLTRLPNRMLFADRFQQAIARTRREGKLLAICYLDLDGFKQVNDTLGHDAGDRLLVEVAERIKSNLREEDTVSRLGGDEFSLLLGDLDSLEQFELALHRIHLAIARPYSIDGESVTIAASSGVTLYPMDDEDADTLLRHADQAMYQAKLAGRNRFHLFDASQDQQAQSRQAELAIIEQALANDEFRLYYQPKVDMESGQVIGAEALIRWIDPQRGVRPPGEFLPVIEGSAFEITLGNWVIEQAMLQLKAWLKLGLGLQISINISPKHLHWPGFANQIESALAQHPEVDSHLLQLEVLESSILGDLNTVSEVIRSCRDALGVSIALDDFGTGYSALTHLRHLSVNTIKIDQSFVRDMIDDPNDFTIIEGVIGLAHAFRREVVAEGVETREHGLMLMTLGCTLAQGYGIARPMPADQLPAWVRDYQPDPKWQDFARNPLDPLQTQIMLLVIEGQQWVRRLETCLQAEPGSQPHWPIMHEEKCHCGRWILQARRTKETDQRLIDALNAAHNDLHRLGNELMQVYLSGNVMQARSRLNELHNAHAQVEMVIEQLS